MLCCICFQHGLGELKKDGRRWLEKQPYLRGWWVPYSSKTLAHCLERTTPQPCLGRKSQSPVDPFFLKMGLLRQVVRCSDLGGGIQSVASTFTPFAFRDKISQRRKDEKQTETGLWTTAALLMWAHRTSRQTWTGLEDAFLLSSRGTSPVIMMTSLD